jgi:hypothetical protein
LSVPSWFGQRRGGGNLKIEGVVFSLTQGIMTKWTNLNRTKNERTLAQTLYLRNMNGFEGMNLGEG